MLVMGFCITNQIFSKEKNLITTDLLTLTAGVLNARYEKPFKNNSTLEFRGAILSQNIGDWKLNGFGLGAGYYFYPNKNLLKELFYGPSVNLSIVNAEYTYQTVDINTMTLIKTTDKASGTLISLGFEVGYKWIFKGGYTLGVGVGVGLGIGEITVAGSKLNYGSTGLSRLSLDIGYAW